MLNKAIAYHLEQLRQNQHVLDADGNIFSDQHRQKARKEIEVHNAILAELDAVNQPMEAAPCLDVLTEMLEHHTKRLHSLDVRIEGVGAGASRDAMTNEVGYLKPERDALEAAVLAQREIAARPTVTHLKRGSHYDEYGRGILQTERPLKDNDEIVIYRDRLSRRWFVRPPTEMDDGRFKAFDPVSGKVAS